jgi:hypothetical protein
MLPILHSPFSGYSQIVQKPPSKKGKVFLFSFKNGHASSNRSKNLYFSKKPRVLLSRYTEVMDKLDSIDESTLSEADDAYYTAVMLRISAKILEATEAIS